MRVETQAEFDAAVAAGEIAQIYTNGVFYVRGGAPSIVTREPVRPAS